MNYPDKFCKGLKKENSSKISNDTTVFTKQKNTLITVDVHLQKNENIFQSAAAKF